MHMHIYHTLQSPYLNSYGFENFNSNLMRVCELFMRVMKITDER